MILYHLFVKNSAIIVETRLFILELLSRRSTQCLIRYLTLHLELSPAKACKYLVPVGKVIIQGILLDKLKQACQVATNQFCRNQSCDREATQLFRPSVFTVYASLSFVCVYDYAIMNVVILV